MTVSEILLEVLAAHGVGHLFGISGDAINEVTDALRRQDRIASSGFATRRPGRLRHRFRPSRPGVFPPAWAPPDRVAYICSTGSTTRVWIMRR